jgi:hypothetical protein
LVSSMDGFCAGDSGTVIRAPRVQTDKSVWIGTNGSVYLDDTAPSERSTDAATGGALADRTAQQTGDVLASHRGLVGQRRGAGMILREVVLAVMLLSAPAAQSQSVVAEAAATGDYGVAALQASLNWQRRYGLQVDGPPGAGFTARYLQVYVSRQPGSGGSGNDDGSFEGVVPYTQELAPPAPNLIFWRYSIVVSPSQPAELVARVVDLGPR